MVIILILTPFCSYVFYPQYRGQFHNIMYTLYNLPITLSLLPFLRVNASVDLMEGLSGLKLVVARLNYLYI